MAKMKIFGGGIILGMALNDLVMVWKIVPPPESLFSAIVGILVGAWFYHSGWTELEVKGQAT